MDCPNCGNRLIDSGNDCRSEWAETYYEKCECGKSYYRRTTYQIQSSLVASDELIEVKEGE